MPNLSPYGTFGANFGGATSGYGQPTNPFTPEHTPTGGYDANLFDDQEGRGALGFYATSAGQAGDQPFRDWLESPTTRHNLWTDYEGQYAARSDPTFSFTRWLGESDPYSRYAGLSYADRGVANPGSQTPFASLLNLG